MKFTADIRDDAGRPVSTPVTRVPVRMSIPCRLNVLAASERRSASMPARIVSIISTTTTSVPTRCYTEPISSPM